MYGKVTVRRDGSIVNATLLEFTTLPLNWQSEDGTESLKAIVFGILETEDGQFFARNLKDIRRAKRLEATA